MFNFLSENIQIFFRFPEPERLREIQKAPVHPAAKVRDGVPTSLGDVLLRCCVQHEQNAGDRQVGAERLHSRRLELSVCEWKLHECGGWYCYYVERLELLFNN